MQAWVKEMAAYVKSLDPNHLLTVGEEGFYPPSGQMCNPQYNTQYVAWPAFEGQDFVLDHTSPDIDFTAFHSWVDNWGVSLASACCLIFSGIRACPGVV